jgi:hypothetical protein
MSLTLIKGYKDMIILKNTIFLKDSPFQRAFGEFITTKMPPKACYDAEKIMKKIGQQSKQVDKEILDLMEKHLVDVTKINEEGKEVTVKDYADKETANIEFKELYDREFTIETSKIQLSDLPGFMVSPSELELLRPIIDGL